MSIFDRGPIAPYRNPPIEPQDYQPRFYSIADITRGVTTLVETDDNHDFVVGQLVRLLIPVVCKIQQVNRVQAYVSEVPAANEVVLNLNTVNADAFVPFTGNGTPPVIVPVGDGNLGIENPNGRIQPLSIPGSFINIS